MHMNGRTTLTLILGTAPVVRAEFGEKMESEVDSEEAVHDEAAQLTSGILGLITGPRGVKLA